MDGMDGLGSWISKTAGSAAAHLEEEEGTSKSSSLGGRPHDSSTARTGGEDVRGIPRCKAGEAVLAEDQPSIGGVRGGTGVRELMDMNMSN